eukprot:15263958-Alexandrium_andersonii.AAC.1
MLIAERQRRRRDPRSASAPESATRGVAKVVCFPGSCRLARRGPLRPQPRPRAGFSRAPPAPIAG